MTLENRDRRLFLQGLTLSSAGLIVPRSIISVPAIAYAYVHWGPIGYEGDARLYGQMVERVGGTIIFRPDGSSVARYRMTDGNRIFTSPGV